jgi:YVTN family beta-propeller protein
MLHRGLGALAAVVILGQGSASAAEDRPREIGPATTVGPHAVTGGFELPNGWRITPAGAAVGSSGDLVLKISPAPDGKALIANHSGYLPHGLTVIDPVSRKVVQEIRLRSSWLGLAWSPDGKTLYVSGGNAAGGIAARAPVYAFAYANGRLSEAPVAQFDDTVPLEAIWWSGVAHHPTKDLLYAANRGADGKATYVAVFDAASHALVTRIPVEISPYELVFSRDGRRLFVSNWSSNSVSVIDTASNRVVGTIRVGANPNDMALAADGRLFVACSADNTIHVIDTKTLRVVERLSTTLTPLAPEGATPNAVLLDPARGLLYVANADNNDVMVADIRRPGHAEVTGFIPTGWYPAALALGEKGQALYVGAAKGEAAYADPKGPHSPLPGGSSESVKSLQTSTIERIPLDDLAKRLPAWTAQVQANTPYRDDLLAQARPSATASVIPRQVGAGSPIEHVIYIIRENRTYDQVLGDLPKGNGDPRLAIFGAKVTPNGHALATQFATFDNFYADGEVSVDGHSWSNSAYATDFNEKFWPPTYGDHSKGKPAPAYVPAAGHLWDLARRKGLTYRSFGEYASRVSEGEGMVAREGVDGLVGHVNKDYVGFEARDTDNLAVFLRDFSTYEAKFDSPDPEDRLPNFVVMSMGEDHTRGTRAGAFTPTAMVANNDWALGQLVDRVSHSRYWATTAIFVLEDDAQDGPDHVDARRTVALAISPYIRRGAVDSTLYSTSSVVRTIELLLGLPPMSQYDAAATPMYAAFGVTPDLTPYVALAPQVDVMAKNQAAAWGAKASARMDFADEDRAPMGALNEILWRSVMGSDAAMPAPVHRYRALIDVGGGKAGAGRADRD